MAARAPIATLTPATFPDGGPMPLVARPHTGEPTRCGWRETRGGLLEGQRSRGRLFAGEGKPEDLAISDERLCGPAGNVGGDVAFLTGVLRHLIERGWVDEEFVADRTEGFEAGRRQLGGFG